MLMLRWAMAVVALGLLAQQPDAPAQSGTAPVAPYVIAQGTRVPLSMINSVSTKHAAEGDRVYLETVFPILAEGKVVIPTGSYVAGTVTQVKRPGRVKGRGELYIRFDSLTLPNGITRDFRARIASLDSQSSRDLEKNEGKVISEGGKGSDARTIGEAAAGGTTVGTIAGSAAGHAGMGAGIGAAAGATAGLVGVLLTRGPDAMLPRGTTLEMVLDRSLSFNPDEVQFDQTTSRRGYTDGAGSAPQLERRPLPIPGARLPGSSIP